MKTLFRTYEKVNAIFNNFSTLTCCWLTLKVAGKTVQILRVPANLKCANKCSVVKVSTGGLVFAVLILSLGIE